MISIIGRLALYEEGRMSPFSNGYRPLFNIKGNKYSGKIILEEKKQLFPGEKNNVIIEFLTDNLNIKEGDTITFDEGTNKILGEVEILKIRTNS
jgi:elongation factor Tu